MSTEFDYDLEACLTNNPQKGFVLEDISVVLAVWEGQNDGDDWRWVLKLKDDRFVFLQGGCDYTGWDCQSWASHVIFTSLDEFEDAIKGELPITESSPMQAGLGHMLSAIFGHYLANAEEVYQSLLRQLRDGKDQTWREKMDKEFGIDGEVES